MCDLGAPKHMVKASENSQSPTNARRARYLAIASAVVSILCLAMIAGIWISVSSAPPAPYPGEIPITRTEEAKRILDENVHVASGDASPIYIPTGIFIESLEFKGPYTLQTSGFVWQRYADELPKDLDRGIIFPEAESATFNKVYETHQGNETLIGWSFKATMREEFNYARYPLDRQQIWFQMWHPDFERDVYLMPDVNGYATMDPQARPGLDPDVVLENWRVDSSYFSYRLNQYNANFGIQEYDPTQSTPELYFNLSAQRGLLHPLMSRLIVPLVILLQLFVIVLVIGSDNKRLEQFGVRPGAVIFTCAAFFFAVLVAQNALRDEVKAGGIVYLETVHLLTYLVILGVAINSVLLVALPNLGLFRDNDNMWVEVLYWPLFLFAFLLITLFAFNNSNFQLPPL